MIGLDMIWGSSLVIGVMLVLRGLLGKKCNPNIRYMLWILVAIRILLPIEFVFEVEKDSFVATVVETGEETRRQVVTQIVSPVLDEDLLRESEDRVPNADMVEKKSNTSEGRLTSDTEKQGNFFERVQLTALLRVVWIVGSICLALYWIGLNIYSFSRIQKKRLTYIRARVPVYEVEEMNGLVGVIRPKIFISSQIVGDEERRGYVLAHELQHLRVGDHIWQFVRCLCVIAQWFNPLVWLAYFKSQEDCELACDYRVLKGLDAQEHAGYAETLLYILKMSRGRSQVLMTAMGDDKKNMKTRLEGIMKKQNRKPLIGAVAIIIVLAVGITTFAKYKVQEENSKYQLKQIEMLDEQCGWGITVENELVYTQAGLSGFSVRKSFDGISRTTDGFLHADFVGNHIAYVTYYEDGTQELVVEYTSNQGESWQKTKIPYKDYAKVSDAGSAYLSFVDESTGYLLYCSTPAAGQMVKLLFMTGDGGESFRFVQDLTEIIEGYPQGLTFMHMRFGYIAVTHHGQEAYLYETVDYGETWYRYEAYDKPSKVSYIDGFAPVFYGENRLNGIMLAKEVSDKASYRLLTTNDGGANWKSEGDVEIESVRNYGALDEESFYIVDMQGNVRNVTFAEALPIEEVPEMVESEEYIVLDTYTGYLDEFEHDIYDFSPEDMDGDGLADRIYKTYLEENSCAYRLELGNGEKIDLGIEASSYTVPDFAFVDLTGDGKQDIIYHANPPIGANGGPWALDFAILVNTEGGYEVAELPFEEGISGPLRPYLVFDYDFVSDDMIRVLIENYEDEILIPYGEGTSLEYYYKNNVDLKDYVQGFGEKQISEVYEYYVDTSSTPASVICSSMLFGKWSECELAAKLRYENDAFVLEEIVLDENIYDGEVAGEVY